MSVTAKAVVSEVTERVGTRALTFVPDYANGANAEWAQATPSLHVQITVREDVDLGKPGDRYTLTFTKEESGDSADPAAGDGS